MIERLSDEQLNEYIMKAIKNSSSWVWEDNIRSVACSNIALIEIQLRMLKQIKSIEEQV